MLKDAFLVCCCDNRILDDALACLQYNGKWLLGIGVALLFHTHWNCVGNGCFDVGGNGLLAEMGFDRS